MRRLLPLPVIAVVLAACGGGSKTPLEEGLSYAPKDTPFVAVIDTDVDGDQYRALGQLVGRFPFGNRAKEELRQSLEREGGRVSYERDVKPLLGNPFVVAATDARSFVERDEGRDFVAAVKAKDKDKLQELVDRSKPKEQGEAGDAKLYEDDDGDLFAINDDTLVVASSRKVLEASLERGGGENGLQEADLQVALDGLPQDSLVKTFVNVRGLLRADPDAAEARKVKWVNSLSTLGAVATVEERSVKVDFKLRSGGGITPGDVPFASGSGSPEVVQQRDEVNLGLRDPSQVVEFAENAGQSVDPSGFSQYEQLKERLANRYKVDVQRDVLDELTGDMSVNVAVNGDFGVRAELKNPARFKRTLARAVKAVPQLSARAGAGTTGIAKRGKGNFYAAAQSDGDSILFGVVDDVLVVSNDPDRAGKLGGDQPTAVEGADGSFVVTADAERVARQALSELGPRLGVGGALGGSLFTRPLGDLEGSVSSTTGGLRGKFSLAVD